MGHLGILKPPLDTYCFKVKLFQRFCQGCLSQGFISLSWIYDNIWQRCWSGEVGQGKYSSVFSTRSCFFFQLSLLWGFSEDIVYLGNYTMLFCMKGDKNFKVKRGILFFKYCRKYNVQSKYVIIYENRVKEFASYVSIFLATVDDRKIQRDISSFVALFVYRPVMWWSVS